jgi:hypothetical protein
LKILTFYSALLFLKNQNIIKATKRDISKWGWVPIVRNQMGPLDP